MHTALSIGNHKLITECSNKIKNGTWKLVNVTMSRARPTVMPQLMARSGRYSLWSVMSVWLLDQQNTNDLRRVGHLRSWITTLSSYYLIWCNIFEFPGGDAFLLNELDGNFRRCSWYAYICRTHEVRVAFLRCEMMCEYTCWASSRICDTSKCTRVLLDVNLLDSTYYNVSNYDFQWLFEKIEI